MKKWSLLLFLFVCFSFNLDAEAHSGRTDSSGGHNCSEKSKAKGLCTGYHYHNGGTSSTTEKSTPAPVVPSTPAAAPKEQKPVYNPKVHYDKGYEAGYAKGLAIGYEQGKKDLASTDSNEDFTEGWDAGFKTGYGEGLSKKETEEKQAKDKEDGAAKGEKDGRKAFEEGKAEREFMYNDEMTDIYKTAYKTAFVSAWTEAKTEVTCFEDGYKQGFKQDKVEVSTTCEKDSVRSEFEEGHEEGVAKRDIKEIEKLTQQGESLGYEVAELVIPSEVKKASYKAAIEKGYDQGMGKRKKEIQAEGYDSAFKQVGFENEVYTENEVLGTWYREGYDSNTVAEEIKTTAQTLGEENDEYVIADEYKVNSDAVTLYDTLFAQGQEIKEEREQEQRSFMLAVAAVGAPAAGGLYFWRRKRKNQA